MASEACEVDREPTSALERLIWAIFRTALARLRTGIGPLPHLDLP